jgi:hypothetical protein
MSTAGMPISIRVDMMTLSPTTRGLSKYIPRMPLSITIDLTHII